MNLLLVLCVVLWCCHLWFNKSVEVLPYLQVSGLIECSESGSIAKVVKGVMSFSSTIVFVYLKWDFILFVLFISVE